MPEVKEVDTECCGQHETCEKDSLLAAVSKKIEYYDDEELDEFVGRFSDEYTEEEAELFRDVLYTMQEVEVAGWITAGHRVSRRIEGRSVPDHRRKKNQRNLEGVKGKLRMARQT